MRFLPRFTDVWMFSVAGFLTLSPVATGIQPLPTKEDPSISIYDDESVMPLFQHHNTVALFLGASAFGAERAQASLISHSTLDPYIMSWSDDEGRYDAKVIDLIGLLKAPRPRVYATMQNLYAGNKMPEEDPDPTTPEERAEEMKKLRVPNLPLTTIQRDSKQKKDWKIRELDSFEAKALEQLRAGHALVWKDQGASFRAVGAIRMQASCTRCHEDKKIGDLLGAFTYFGFKATHPAEEDRAFERKLAELALQEPYSKEFVDARNNNRHPNDTGERDEWPILPELVFYIDRELAQSGIVTQGMLKRQKAILSRLPRVKDDDQEPEAK
jgi:hypothetical protein